MFWLVIITDIVGDKITQRFSEKNPLSLFKVRAKGNKEDLKLFIVGILKMLVLSLSSYFFISQESLILRMKEARISLFNL